MSILENYRRVVDTIAANARKCGRNAADILLVAVTKEQLWEEMRQIYDYGCRDFGESKIQDALPKVNTTPEDIYWHFVGPLQKNKVAKAINSFELIHSVDSYELAQAISKYSLEQDLTTRILLEVNTSGEATKHGFEPEKVSQNLHLIQELPCLQVEGFMTIAPFVQDERLVRSCFARLWDLRDKIVMESFGKIHLPHLSMGMSNDYQWAIQEGATILRIGRAIFG